ncbi:hypothetical protein [Streptomyces sp. NPDC003077]|uniref:hypothetical protein n=1 Tax=Streptomyces sp. NPDC003077 TaxID=3154443 RepID=UPI0033B43074
MGNTKPYYCTTCGAYEPHRAPETEREREWLRHTFHKRYVEDYWICTVPDCRNVRYARKVYDPPIPMPDFD